MDEKVDVKRVTDPKIKITGYRDKKSKILTLKAIAKEKNMPFSHVIAEATEQYILRNLPEVG